MPTAASLVIRGLAEGPRSADEDVVHDGDISMDQIIEIAREMRPKSIAKTLSGTVKEILGTALYVRALSVNDASACASCVESFVAFAPSPLCLCHATQTTSLREHVSPHRTCC